MTPTPAALAAAALLLGLLAGCSGGDDASPSADASAPASAGPRVLQPGLPGEPATEVTDPTPAVPPAATEADVAFARDMVVHHAQALEMAALAPTRAASDEVRLLAERISAAQGPEIAFLGQWLADRDELDPATADVVAATTDRDDLAPSDAGGHGGGHGSGHGSGHTDHAGMPGMATAADLERLGASRGAAFDRLFLTLMVRHHEGALSMVDDVVADGRDLQIAELAADVNATQSTEIARMQDLLRGA